MDKKLAAFATLVLLAATDAFPQTADQIIERFIAATGGRAAYAKLRSRSSSGTIALSTPAGEMMGSVEMLNEAPNKSRTLIKVDLTALGAGQLVLDQRFDGVDGYVLDTLQGNRPMEGGQLETLRNGSFPHPLLNYKELGATVQLIGKEKVGDRDAHVIVLEPPSGPQARFSIDAETFLLLEVVVKLEVPQLGRDVEQTTTLHDYRDVDGVKLPYQIRATSAIQNFTITFTTVEHNVRVDPALFVMPPVK